MSATPDSISHRLSPSRRRSEDVKKGCLVCNYERAGRGFEPQAHAPAPRSDPRQDARTARVIGDKGGRRRRSTSDRPSLLDVYYMGNGSESVDSGADLRRHTLAWGPQPLFKAIKSAADVTHVRQAQWRACLEAREGLERRPTARSSSSASRASINSLSIDR